MSEFVGADVEQLDALAHRLEKASQRLRTLVDQSSTSISMAAWTGTDIDALRSQWNRVSKTQLLTSGTAMGALALALRTQASQQREASGGPVSFPGFLLPGFGITLPTWLTPNMFPSLPFENWADDDWATFIDRIKSTAGNVLTAVDIGKVIGELRDLPGLTSLTKILGPISLAFTANEVVIAIQNGDFFTAARHTLSGGVSLADLALGASSTLGPLALGISAFNGLVDIAIPVSGQEQDETIAMGAQHMFGKDVDMNNLTPVQSAAIVNRYELPAGPLLMISDTMDATAQKIFPWNW